MNFGYFEEIWGIFVKDCYKFVERLLKICIVGLLKIWECCDWNLCCMNFERFFWKFFIVIIMVEFENVFFRFYDICDNMFEDFDRVFFSVFLCVFRWEWFYL